MHHQIQWRGERFGEGQLERDVREGDAHEFGEQRMRFTPFRLVDGPHPGWPEGDERQRDKSEGERVSRRIYVCYDLSFVTTFCAIAIQR